MNLNSAFVLCLFFLFMDSAIAQTQLPADSAYARVLFYRNTGALKSATACKIYSADRVIAKVGNKSAWTELLAPGEYSFQAHMSLDNEKGETLKLSLEKGKLYWIEIKLKGGGQRQVIPSAGYSFALKPVIEKRYPALLRQKVISEAIRDALYDAFLREYQLK